MTETIFTDLSTLAQHLRNKLNETRQYTRLFILLYA